MQELISITSQPAVVEVNFDELREALKKELERYDVLVTGETVGDAKKLATELNKTKKAIDDRLKEEIAKASAPIKAVDAKRKELVKLCEEGRQGLMEQIKRFEDEVRELACKMLREYRAKLWEEQGVRDEFRASQVDDLAIVSSLTSKNNLTAKAKEQTRGRVQIDKALQDQTDRRILELDGRSRECGLDAPIERGHVEAFLMEPDEVYLPRLEKILQTEQNRQERAKQAERERIEREQREAERQRLEQEKREQEAEEARIRAEQEAARREAEQTESPDPEPEPEVDPLYSHEEPAPAPAMEWVNVKCTFSIQVPAETSSQSIEEALRHKMREAGFQSSPQIKVIRLG